MEKDSKLDEINQELVDQILLAIKLGYRHIDTAEVYNTQAEVGEAIKQSGIPRNSFGSLPNTTLVGMILRQVVPVPKNQLTKH